MKESSKGLPSSGISWTSQESPSSGVTFYQELPSSGFSWSSSQASGGCPVFSQYYFLFCMDIEKKMKVLVAQSCPTLCNPMDYGPPGSSVHGILQGRILEWVAMPFSRGFSQPRDWTWVSCHCRQIIYCLSQKVYRKLYLSPVKLVVILVSLVFSLS